MKWRQRILVFEVHCGEARETEGYSPHKSSNFHCDVFAVCGQYLLRFRLSSTVWIFMHAIQSILWLTLSPSGQA